MLLWLASVFAFWTNWHFIEMHWIFWMCHYHWEIFQLYWYTAWLSFEKWLKVPYISFFFNSSTIILLSSETVPCCGTCLPVLEAARAILRSIYVNFFETCKALPFMFSLIFSIHLCILSEVSNPWVISPWYCTILLNTDHVPFILHDLIVLQYIFLNSL